MIVHILGLELPDRNAAAQRVRNNALPGVRACHVGARTGINLDPDDREDAVGTLCEVPDPQAVIAMKRYYRGHGALTAQAFKAPVSEFLTAVTGKGNACPSIA